ncbi:unnamed protein product, partial [Discosporangium mesarthrocarpum]
STASTASTPSLPYEFLLTGFLVFFFSDLFYFGGAVFCLSLFPARVVRPLHVWCLWTRGLVVLNRCLKLALDLVCGPWSCGLFRCCDALKTNNIPKGVPLLHPVPVLLTPKTLVASFPWGSTGSRLKKKWVYGSPTSLGADPNQLTGLFELIDGNWTD